MKKWILNLFVILLVLSLCSCYQSRGKDPTESTSESASVTSATPSAIDATESIPEESVISLTTEPDPTETMPLTTQQVPEGIPLDEDAISQYQELLTRQKNTDGKGLKNWYNMAMCMEFDSPENIDWNILFYNGTGEGSTPLTGDELQYLEQMGFPMELDAVRLSPEKMDEIALQYFGVTLDSSHQVGINDLVFYSQTGCYYRYVSDVMSMDDFTVYEGYTLENDDIRLYYIDNILQRKYAITLRGNPSVGEGGYYIISNLVLR